VSLSAVKGLANIVEKALTRIIMRAVSWSTYGTTPSFRTTSLPSAGTVARRISSAVAPPHHGPACRDRAPASSESALRAPPRVHPHSRHPNTRAVRGGAQVRCLGDGTRDLDSASDECTNKVISPLVLPVNVSLLFEGASPAKITGYWDGEEQILMELRDGNCWRLRYWR